MVKKKNREQTRQRLLDAARALLLEEGFESLGVNAVARRAGVDKVLIYRYFGGLPGLLEELSPRVQKMSVLGEIAPPRTREELAAVLCEALDGQIQSMRENPLELEFQRWLLAEQNGLTDQHSEALERSGMELMSLFAHWKAPEGMDLSMLCAVLSSGLTFLALRSRTYPYYMGNDMTADSTWEAMRETMHQVTYQLVRSLEERGDETS